MTAQPVAPIIIKRKKVVAGGHHSGAWKVAYADFVTAMMAFFLLMWLLGATNEQQRKGIADFFNPTVPVNKISGGGDGAFGGNSVFEQNTLAQTGTGTGVTDAAESSAGNSAEDEALAEIEAQLSAKAGESMISELLRRHIVTRITDEGLIVEIFDLPDVPLFSGDAEPTAALLDTLAAVAEVFRLAPNEVAVQGHVASVPIVSRRNPVWELSAERANVVRGRLIEAGLEAVRMQRVTGFADRQPVTRNPLAARNNRIEVILLRSRL